MPDVTHMMRSKMKLTTTLKLVSFSIFDRLEGVSPPFSMIKFESAPVNTTRPMTHVVFLRVHPRRRSSLIVTDSIFCSPDDGSLYRNTPW